MGVGEDFENFCSNITVDNREIIGQRYRRITRQLNQDFWESDSENRHSLYVGSYGRGTARRGFSDLDMIFELPYKYYRRYNEYIANGQSALLQTVKRSLQKTYSSTDIGGDGQVVAISFSDGMRFEVVPVFESQDSSYTYPDANDQGKWKVTNPRPEIAAIASMDAVCNGNLKWLCRMARSWKNEWSAPMGGLLIDTLAHRFLKDWEYNNKSFIYYDWMSKDFFNYLANEPERDYWLAVGSGQYIWPKGKFQYKAKQCHKLALEAIDYTLRNMPWSASQKWREVYGTAYL